MLLFNRLGGLIFHIAPSFGLFELLLLLWLLLVLLLVVVSDRKKGKPACSAVQPLFFRRDALQPHAATTGFAGISTDAALPLF